MRKGVVGRPRSNGPMRLKEKAALWRPGVRALEAISRGGCEESRLWWLQRGRGVEPHSEGGEVDRGPTVAGRRVATCGGGGGITGISFFPFILILLLPCSVSSLVFSFYLIFAIGIKSYSLLHFSLSFFWSFLVYIHRDMVTMDL